MSLSTQRRTSGHPKRVRPWLMGDMHGLRKHRLRMLLSRQPVEDTGCFLTAAVSRWSARASLYTTMGLQQYFSLFHRDSASSEQRIRLQLSARTCMLHL